MELKKSVLFPRKLQHEIPKPFSIFSLLAHDPLRSAVRILDLLAGSSIHAPRTQTGFCIAEALHVGRADVGQLKFNIFWIIHDEMQ